MEWKDVLQKAKEVHCGDGKPISHGINVMNRGKNFITIQQGRKLTCFKHDKLVSTDFEAEEAYSILMSFE